MPRSIDPSFTSLIPFFFSFFFSLSLLVRSPLPSFRFSCGHVTDPRRATETNTEKARGKAVQCEFLKKTEGKQEQCRNRTRDGSFCHLHNRSPMWEKVLLQHSSGISGNGLFAKQKLAEGTILKLSWLPIYAAMNDGDFQYPSSFSPTSIRRALRTYQNTLCQCNSHVEGSLINSPRFSRNSESSSAVTSKTILFMPLGKTPTWNGEKQPTRYRLTFLKVQT